MPRLDAKWFHGICALGPRPHVVTGWLKIWLAGHFAIVDNLEDQNTDGPLPRMLYRGDGNQQLVIESIQRWMPKKTEIRPALIIKRRAWKRQQMGIGDRLQGGDQDGKMRFETFWSGSHTVFCIANDGTECELLATETFRELNQHAPIVRQILSLNKLGVVEVGELAILENEGRENFVIPITMAYVYSDTWIVSQEAPAFKGISLDMLSAAMD